MSEDIKFNHPDFDPKKFDPLKPKVHPGLTFEEHQRIVSAALKHMKVAKKEEGDLERHIKEAKRRIQLVRQFALLMEQEVRASGQDLNRQQLWVDVMTKYLDNFGHYNKDEILFLLAHFLTELTMNEV